MATNTLDIYIWDVGHGLSASVITPYVAYASGFPILRERVIQVDAGHHSETGFSPFENLLQFNHRVVDCLVISHFDQDHISDLANMAGVNLISILRNKSYPTNLISDDPTKESTAKSILRRLHTSYIHPLPSCHLLTAANYGGVTTTSGHLPYSSGFETNDCSVITSFEFGSLQIIFPGDITSTSFELLRQAGQLPLPNFYKYRFLVASHHGRKSAEPRGILEFYKPHLVLASAADGDSYTDPIYSGELVSGYQIDSSTSPSKFVSTKNSKAIKITVDPSKQFRPSVSFFGRTTTPKLDDLLEQVLQMRSQGYP